MKVLVDVEIFSSEMNKMHIILTFFCSDVTRKLPKMPIQHFLKSCEMKRSSNALKILYMYEVYIFLNLECLQHGALEVSHLFHQFVFHAKSWERKSGEYETKIRPPPQHKFLVPPECNRTSRPAHHSAQDHSDRFLDYSDRMTGPLGPYDFTTWIVLGLIWLSTRIILNVIFAIE